MSKKKEDIEEIEEVEEEKEEVEKKQQSPEKIKNSEGTPEWAKTLNNSMNQLIKSIQPMETKKATVEIPIPKVPEKEEDPESHPMEQQQEQTKKRSFLDWLM